MFYIVIVFYVTIVFYKIVLFFNLLAASNKKIIAFLPCHDECVTSIIYICVLTIISYLLNIDILHLLCRFYGIY